MFSLILKIQALFESLKKRKALWFTMITTFAFFGIVGTLYYLNSVTDRATKSLYEATNVSYFAEISDKIATSLYRLESIGVLLITNQEFMAILEQTEGVSEALKQRVSLVDGKLNLFEKQGAIIELYNKELVKTASTAQNATLTTEAYDSEGLKRVVATNTPLSTIEYQDGKVYLRALFPVANGVLEIKRPTDFLFGAYANNGKIFQILLDKDALDMKKLQSHKHQKVGRDEVSVQEKVDESFLAKMAELDIDKVIENKYVLTDDYFVLAKPLINVENKKIGAIIVGESIMKENSLPKMAKKVSTGLTTAALGLVVALLVLMI